MRTERSCGIEAVDAAFEALLTDGANYEANAMMDAVENLIERHDTAVRLCVPSHLDLKDEQFQVFRRAIERTIRRVTDLIG